jgi:hypothetical protein
MQGKTASEIKAKMTEVKIPEAIYKPLLPVEEAKEGEKKEEASPKEEKK